MSPIEANTRFSNVLKSRDNIVMHELEEALKLEEENTDTIEKYKKLQEALILYKQGDKSATEYIIKRFHNFISMYSRFICHKYVYYNVTIIKDKKTGQLKNVYKIHPSLKSFMFLYCSKDDKLKYSNKGELYNALTQKIFSLFHKFEYSDIYNELVLALLNMANKYKITHEGDEYHKENGTFHMYVSKCFHYEAKRALDKIINDPINLSNVPLINDLDDIDLENNKGEYKIITDEKAIKMLENALNNASRECQLRDTNKLTQKEENLDFLDIDTLNFNWTNGITCSEIFTDLSNIEREILVMYYIKKMTIKQLCEIYHTSRNNINKYKDSAIEKVKNNLNKNKY